MDKRIIFYMIFLGVTFYLMQTFFAPKSTIKKEVAIERTQTEKSETASRQISENYYVLENEYQQIVFSDLTGSVVEINLPLSTKNDKSVIRPIGFDKEIDKNDPNNALFPQKNYFSYGFVKNDPQKGGYYPLLRRSIFDKNGSIEHKLSPKYYALNIQDSEGQIDNVKYEVTKFEKNIIEFKGVTSKGTITKTFYFDLNDGAPYTFNVKVKVDGQNQPLWLSSGVLEVELTSNASTPSLKYRTLKNNKYITSKISLPKNVNETHQTYIDWLSNSNGFFGVILDPIEQTKKGYITEYIPGNKAPTRLSLIDSKYNVYPAQKYPGYETFVPITQSNAAVEYRIFAGPYQNHYLSVLDDLYSKPMTGYFPDYLSVKSSKGWFSFASEPFAKFLFLIMKLFHKITSSWGLSIILLTIVFRIMLYPLNSWSINSTLKMQEMSPMLKMIDAKYKKDPQKANMEKMKLFKEKGANPLSGCLPILIQLPFLFGMFNLLKNTFELRGVSFIPGWIDNLTAPDVLFSWNYPIILIGNSFHLLPFALGAVMFIQSKMNAKVPADKSKMTDQQKQQMIMTYAMPVLFTVLFYKAASGLNIYFFFSMLLGILQQWYISKHKPKKNKIKLVK